MCIKWNDDWRDNLNEKMLIRLCECRNTKRDIFIMSKAMYKVNPNRTFEECLNRMIEWVLYWNSQWKEMTITNEEYRNWIEKMS